METPKALIPNVPEPTEFQITQQSNFRNIYGMFETIDAVPTGEPIKFSEQIKIYTNSTTYRLYWYDSLNKTWHYITATA